MVMTRSAAVSTALLLAAAWPATGYAEPSQDDVTRAIQAELKKNQDALAQVGGAAAAARFALKVHSAKKLACTKAGERVFTCEVEIDVTEPPLDVRQKGVRSMRFVKASDGWMLSQ